MESPLNYNTPAGPVVNPLATHGRATSPQGNLTLRQVLTTLHRRHRVRFVRFSAKKIPFDPRHRIWGLRLNALLRTHANPDLLVGFIPASVGLTVVDVDNGDFLPLVKKHPPAFHNASGTQGRRHLFYRDTEPRPDVNGWQVMGCSGDVRSAGPVILYDARRLLAALDMGLKGDKFHAASFKTHSPQVPRNTTERDTTHQPDQGTTGGNPFPPSVSPGGGDIGNRYTLVSPTALASSQPCSLFDRLRNWAYAHVADAGDSEDWAEAVQRQAEALVNAVPDPEHYTPARIRTTARSVSGWTWERRDSFTGGGRDVGSAAQAWRARRRAEAAWAVNVSRDSEMVRLSLAGYSQRVIARSMGVSAMAVNRVLKRLEEAEDGAPELRMDVPEPEPVAEDLEPEEQEAEAEAADMRPETLGEAPVGTMGEARSPHLRQLPLLQGFPAGRGH